MARFDVYRMTERDGYLLDVQTDLLNGLNTRIVVPLLPRASAPLPAQRLNPVLGIQVRVQVEVQAIELVMVTQYLAAVPKTELKEVVGNLKDSQAEISAALDMVFSGF